MPIMFYYVTFHSEDYCHLLRVRSICLSNSTKVKVKAKVNKGQGKVIGCLPLRRVVQPAVRGVVASKYSQQLWSVWWWRQRHRMERWLQFSHRTAADSGRLHAVARGWTICHAVLSETWGSSQWSRLSCVLSLSGRTKWTGERSRGTPSIAFTHIIFQHLCSTTTTICM